MKKDIHVTIEDKILADLNEMSEKLKVTRATLLEGIAEKGIKEIRELNYNFTQFMNK